MDKKKIEIGPTRYAGEGADGEEYGVTSVSSTTYTYRRKPCETCPWSKDSQVGRFPAQAYRESADTAYDASMKTFGCHESGTENPMTCAGFLLVNAENNLRVRIHQMQGTLDLDAVKNSDNVPLYASYREMAEANGVDPEDPILGPCRANFE